MLHPSVEPAPGEMVYVRELQESMPYDPAIHREGFYAGTISRFIGNVTDEQWRIIKGE